jgi:hypothetical protein
VDQDARDEVRRAGFIDHASDERVHFGARLPRQGAGLQQQRRGLAQHAFDFGGWGLFQRMGRELAGDAGGKSVWWRWTAPASGPVQVSLSGSAFSTLLAVYTGPTVGSLTLYRAGPQIRQACAEARHTLLQMAATRLSAPADTLTVQDGVVAESPKPGAPVAEAPATSLDDDLKVVLGRLTGLREVVSTMITEVKKLEKRVHREIKDARKRRRRVKAEGEEGAKPRGPSIFEIPTKVTDELCVFLGKPKGTLISRSNVTREINNYVKEKNLKNKHDIKPDAALKKLLRLTDADNLTYFNLQRYLNTHYVKEPKVVATA